MRLTISMLRSLIVESLDDAKWERFLQIKKQDERILYAEEEFETIDWGTTRAAFSLGNGRVIKLATMSPTGPMANQIEFELAHSEYASLVPAAFEHHPKFYWIVVEEAEPLGTFDRSTYHVNIKDIAEAAASYIDGNKDALNVLPRKAAELAMQLTKICKTPEDARELAVPSQWGVINGRLVVVDSAGHPDNLSAM